MEREPTTSSSSHRARRVVLTVIAGVVVASGAAFLKITDSVRESELVVRIDRRTYDFVLRHRVGWISSVARVVTYVGNTVVVTLVVLGAVAWLLTKRRTGDAVFVAGSAGGAAVLVTVLKHVVGRPRPAAPHRLIAASGAAFPSGHATQSVACYAAIAVVAAASTRSRRSRVLLAAGAAVIAFLVGASRVYLGVHWASDVVSGWLLGAGWLLALAGVRFAMNSPAAEAASRRRNRSGDERRMSPTGQLSRSGSYARRMTHLVAAVSSIVGVSLPLNPQLRWFFFGVIVTLGVDWVRGAL